MNLLLERLVFGKFMSLGRLVCGMLNSLWSRTSEREESASGL